MTTDLRAFADRYTVRDDGTQDPPWSLEIPGNLGAIFQHDDCGRLAVLAHSTAAIRRLSELGLKAVQRGDCEAVFVFDPRLLDQVAAIIQAKRKQRRRTA